MPAINQIVGAGTVAAVCKRTGRDFLAFELQPELVELAQQRLADVGRDALLSPMDYPPPPLMRRPGRSATTSPPTPSSP